MFRINKKLILLLLIFVLVLSTTANAVTQCEVDKIKQALRKALYFFYTNPGSAPMTLNEVKDLLTFYLSIDPNAVTTDCSVLGSISNRAIFDIVRSGENATSNIPKCTDGTEYGQCSGNRPKYCYAGAIYEKCETCGCPSNSFCGKSGKCESTVQNITCYNNIDCGTNKFIGDYYCSYNSIYKNMINYTCVNPGTNNSRCATVNGSVWLAYCYPNLNQICVDGQSTCQTNVTDAAPTVSITVSPTTVAQGQAFNVTMTGTDDVGLSAIWWWAVDSTDTELNKAHWYSCYGAKICTNSWLASTSALGTIKLGANSRDVAYPVAGEAHQASEGAGIAYVTITVTGTTNVSNVSGGLPDLIVSDFKSYTGTTNTYVTISATIKNIGGSVTEGNLCDSLYVETLNARGFCGAKLNPGETRVIQSDYALPVPGTYKIRADTDYGRLVAESNENNNVAWQTITITSPYSADYVKANTDLTVTDIDVQLPTTSSGSTNVYVTTKNLGNLATGQYWVLTKVTNVDTGKITNVQRLAPIVQPGGTYSTHHGSVGIIEYGTYKVEAFVDLSSSAYIFESNEGNNYMVKTIVYGSGANETTTTESVSFHNLSIVNENLIAEYSKNFITCVHLVTSNYGKTSIQNYYCTEGNNIAVSQPVSNFNVTAGQSYKLCHGNNYNICSSLKTLVNLTAPTVSCTDYDNGDNLFVASYAEKGTQKQYDKCGTAGQNYEIIEGVCTNGQLSGVPHSCPSGTVCKDIRYEPAVNANVSACVNQTATSNPDLIVESMTFEPANPTSSDVIKINITVKNIGTATAGSSVLQVNYDPGWYTRLSVPSLVSGGSYSWLLSWTLAANSYTFTATADKDSQVSEQNENNNALVKSLIVTAALNQSTNNTNQTSQQTCTGVSKTVDFENPPHLSFHLTWNPDLGAQDSYNYNLDETARTWLKGKGLVINGTPNGIVWGTKHSGPAGNTGVVIGHASPNFVENDGGISDNEILSVRFIDALVKSVTVGLTVVPSNVSLINNIPAAVTLEAYDSSNNIVGTATKTFTGVTNGAYTPTTMSLSATDFKIAKITLRTTQHPYGGMWLEDISFLSCT